MCGYKVNDLTNSGLLKYFLKIPVRYVSASSKLSRCKTLILFSTLQKISRPDSVPARKPAASLFQSSHPKADVPSRHLPPSIFSALKFDSARLQRCQNIPCLSAAKTWQKLACKWLERNIQIQIFIPDFLPSRRSHSDWCPFLTQTGSRSKLHLIFKFDTSSA